MFNKSSLKIIAIVIIVIFVALFYFGVRSQKGRIRVSSRGGVQSSFLSEGMRFNREGKPWGPLPKVKETYQIISSAGAWPKFLEATIDPPDVHVGDLQKLSVVVEDDVEIVFVEARIQTDKNDVLLPLKLVGPVADAELLPTRYASSKDGIVLIEKPGTAFAETGTLKLKYAGEWIVRDTHDAFYHTTFVAKDALGRENSITLAWSDACGIPASGSWTMSSNCTIFSLDGVENGDAIISAGTLTLNAPFVWNPGRSIVLSGGSIAIGSQGRLEKAYLYYTDADGDGYTPSVNTLSTSTLPSGVPGKVRRATAGIGDCDDTNSSIFLGSTRIRYAALSVACGTASDSETQICQSDSTWSGTYTLTSPPSPSTRVMYLNASEPCGGSCSSETQYCQSNGSWSGSYTNASCSVQSPTTWYRDADADGYGNPALTTSACTQPAGYVSNSSDCYDANANAKPGQLSYFTTNRGDGSFDYDCDGVESLADQSLSTLVCSSVSCSVGGCPAPTGNPGWQSIVPPCGSNGIWQSGCVHGDTLCGFGEAMCQDVPDTFVSTQACK